MKRKRHNPATTVTEQPGAMAPLGKTPPDWRHVRLDEIDEELYAVRTFYCHGRFGPLALLALGEPADARTEGLALADALALGRRLEAAILATNGEAPKRKHSKD